MKIMLKVFVVILLSLFTAEKGASAFQSPIALAGATVDSTVSSSQDYRFSGYGFGIKTYRGGIVYLSLCSQDNLEPSIDSLKHVLKVMSSSSTIVLDLRGGTSLKPSVSDFILGHLIKFSGEGVSKNQDALISSEIPVFVLVDQKLTEQGLLFAKALQRDQRAFVIADTKKIALAHQNRTFHEKVSSLSSIRSGKNFLETLFPTFVSPANSQLELAMYESYKLLEHKSNKMDGEDRFFWEITSYKYKLFPVVMDDRLVHGLEGYFAGGINVAVEGSKVKVYNGTSLTSTFVYLGSNLFQDMKTESRRMVIPVHDEMVNYFYIMESGGRTQKVQR
jgi:hypothetical protein